MKWTKTVHNRMPAALWRILAQDLAEQVGLNNGQLYQMSVKELDEKILQPCMDAAIQDCFQEMIADISDIRYFLGLADKLYFAD